MSPGFQRPSPGPVRRSDPRASPSRCVVSDSDDMDSADTRPRARTSRFGVDVQCGERVVEQVDPRACV